VSGEDALALLVGEGKPFKTVADLAKSKVKADSFIEQLKSENAEMRRTLGSAEASQKTSEMLQAIMDRLNKASDGGGEGGDGNQSGQQGPLTKEDIVELVRTQVSEQQQVRDRLANRTRVNFEVLDMFGGDEAKARAHVSKRSSELGLSIEALRAMAETQPNAYRALMGLTQSAQGNKGDSGLPLSKSVDGGGLPPSGTLDGETRNYAYYKELRKKLGSKYFEPRIQQQLIKDRKALGDKFFDKQT
jgi:hypothetical protein